MKETILDIVDDEENIIGKATFTEAHEKNLLHRTSAILVFNNDDCNEFLVDQRSKKVRLPGMYGLPGGHVDSGENPLEAVKREFAEEVLDLKELPEELDEKLDFEFILKTKKDWDDDLEIIYLYKVIYKGEVKPSSESERLFYKSLSSVFDDIEANNPKYLGTLKGLLKLYREHELNKNKCC